MERLLLLELALWKAHIHNSNLFDNMEEAREYHILESQFDAKAFFTEHCTTSFSQTAREAGCVKAVECGLTQAGGLVR
eukprot:4705561-Ditylum_brightwellii.AAC.1